MIYLYLYVVMMLGAFLAICGFERKNGNPIGRWRSGDWGGSSFASLLWPLLLVGFIIQKVLPFMTKEFGIKIKNEDPKDMSL